MDPDALYQKLYLTSTDLSSAPTQLPYLYIKSFGELTTGRDFQNTQCHITSTIELYAYSAASPNGSQTEARKIMDAAGKATWMGYLYSRIWLLFCKICAGCDSCARFGIRVSTGCSNFK